MHDGTSSIDQQIGQRIAAARQAAGLTARDLAARLVGCQAENEEQPGQTTRGLKHCLYYDIFWISTGYQYQPVLHICRRQRIGIPAPKYAVYDKM
jgi:hypothetical protein